VDELVKEALAEVGLGHDVLEKSPFQLSEGEARRVAIACALVHKPLLLLLDEPLIGLDRIGRQMVQDILKKQKQAGKIIVVTSHRSTIFEIWQTSFSHFDLVRAWGIIVVQYTRLGGLRR